MLEMCSLFAKLKPSLGKLYIEKISSMFITGMKIPNLNRAVEKFYLNKFKLNDDEKALGLSKTI